MNPHNAIKLNEQSLLSLVDSKLGLPFVILNIDGANEPRLHKTACTYVRELMDPDSKHKNKTGSHWLILASDAPSDSTRNCNGKHCWNN